MNIFSDRSDAIFHWWSWWKAVPKCWAPALKAHKYLGLTDLAGHGKIDLINYPLKKSFVEGFQPEMNEPTSSRRILQNLLRMRWGIHWDATTWSLIACKQDAPMNWGFYWGISGE